MEYCPPHLVTVICCAVLKKISNSVSYRPLTIWNEKYNITVKSGIVPNTYLVSQYFYLKSLKIH